MHARRPKRLKKEMVALDARIRPLYEIGLGCRKIASVLCEDPVTVFKRVRRMGILRSLDAAVLVRPPRVPAHERPSVFSRHPHARQLRSAAIGDAIHWFLSRGYTPSIPVDPVRYDLVVESDQGLIRVQVKSTNQKGKSGRWTVHAYRAAYNATSPANANGRRRRILYSSADVDYFFIVTGDRSRYLIPVDSVTTFTLTLDHKYARFKVD